MDSQHPLTFSCPGAEIELKPRHDTITFVISDEQTGDTGSDCGEGRAISSLGRGRAPQRDSLQVYDLHVTVFPVNSQPPSLTAGKPFKPMTLTVWLQWPRPSPHSQGWRCIEQFEATGSQSEQNQSEVVRLPRKCLQYYLLYQTVKRLNISSVFCLPI